MYQSKEITKKVYNRINKSIIQNGHYIYKLRKYRTSEYHVLILKLTDKLYLRRGEKSIALSNLSIYHTWKNIKNSYNNNKFKISASTWNE